MLRDAPSQEGKEVKPRSDDDRNSTGFSGHFSFQWEPWSIQKRVNRARGEGRGSGGWAEDSQGPARIYRAVVRNHR